MEADPSSSSIELDSDNSDISEQTKSNNSSYGEKISENPTSSQLHQIANLEYFHLNEISTSNFQFQLEESFLPMITDSKIESNAKQKTSTQKIPQILPIKMSSEEHLNDSIDLKELLQLIDDSKGQQKKTVPQKVRSVIPNNIPLKEIKSNKSSQKLKPNGNDRIQKHKTQNNSQFQKDIYRSFHPKTQYFAKNDHRVQEKSKNHFPQQFYPYEKRQYLAQNYLPYQQKNMIPQKNSIKIYSEEFASENFMFWGVLISIKLCSFLSLRKNVLLVPFSSSNLNDSISKEVKKRLKFNIREILNIEASKNKQRQLSDGYVFSVKAKGLEQNYRGIYFLKSPPNSQNEGMKYYSVGMLKTSVKSVFDLINSHMEEEIIFPDFEWGSLNQSEICETLIWSIFRQINENRKNYRCLPLKEVIISVNSCENFKLYSKWLKSYVHQLRG